MMNNAMKTNALKINIHLEVLVNTRSHMAWLLVLTGLPLVLSAQEIPQAVQKDVLTQKLPSLHEERI
jgi:hypothetical protein